MVKIARNACVWIEAVALRKPNDGDAEWAKELNPLGESYQ